MTLNDFGCNPGNRLPSLFHETDKFVSQAEKIRPTRRIFLFHEIKISISRDDFRKPTFRELNLPGEMIQTGQE